MVWHVNKVSYLLYVLLVHVLSLYFLLRRFWVAFRLSLHPLVSRCVRDSRHLHGWAHGFGYCLDWPIRDKPPEICGAECGHNLAGFRAVFNNYSRWWTLRGLTVIIRMLAIRSSWVWSWLFQGTTAPCYEFVMTPRTCHQNRAPSREGGENRGRIETLTAGDWA